MPQCLWNLIVNFITMRNFILLVFLIIMMSCQENKNFDKPENLIDVPTMENIVYDLLLMQSIQSNAYTADQMETYFGNEYIYLKYNIDSLQLAESELYYTKFPKVYLDIHKKVLARFTKLKDSMENVAKKEAAEKSRKIP